MINKYNNSIYKIKTVINNEAICLCLRQLGYYCFIRQKN